MVVPLEDHESRVVALYGVDLGREDLQAEHLGCQFARYGGGVSQPLFGYVACAEGGILALDEFPWVLVEVLDALQQGHRVRLYLAYVIEFDARQCH